VVSNEQLSDKQLVGQTLQVKLSAAGLWKSRQVMSYLSSQVTELAYLIEQASQTFLGLVLSFK